LIWCFTSCLVHLIYCFSQRGLLSASCTPGFNMYIPHLPLITHYLPRYMLSCIHLSVAILVSVLNPCSLGLRDTAVPSVFVSNKIDLFYSNCLAPETASVSSSLQQHTDDKASPAACTVGTEHDRCRTSSSAFVNIEQPSQKKRVNLVCMTFFLCSKDQSLCSRTNWSCLLKNHSSFLLGGRKKASLISGLLKAPQLFCPNTFSSLCIALMEMLLLLQLYIAMNTVDYLWFQYWFDERLSNLHSRWFKFFFPNRFLPRWWLFTDIIPGFNNASNIS